jgi:hypothetical protein
VSQNCIAHLWQIQNRFLRSAHLERDFHDPAALSGYIATKFVGSCLARIGEGLRPGSGQRAWRVTGHYGSGKSSFALLLAHALGRREGSLPPQLREVIDFSKDGVGPPEFLPVLVTCSRQSLGRAILQAVHRTLDSAYKRACQTKAAKRIDRLLEAETEPTEEQIVDALLHANAQIIADSRGHGLLLIIDELGKFLEYAALHPERQDVFLLQRLAETASRSTDEPLFLVCLLHQGFDAYSEHLDPSAQREWDKIAGRFEEIIFDQPVPQIGHLIAAALNVRVDEIPKPQAASLPAGMERTIELGWLPAQHRDELLEVSAKLFPLHPTVLPVLIRVFRSFGQNERSLFSFLLSNEPFGLRAFGERPLQGAEPYRLHDLFDYVRTTFGHRLAARSYRSHWNLIDSVVETYAAEDEIQTQILKTVGILNLLDDDLLPSEEAILCALADGGEGRRRQVKAGIERLRNIRRVLHDRGRGHGLSLWSHTSVDLERAYDDARREVGTPRLVAALMQGYVETRPIVARRHYVETGNLRHYEVRHCPVAGLLELLHGINSEADGLIVVPLCESPGERDAALAFARAEDLKKRPNWLVAVPQPLRNLAGLVQEVQRWDWVATNTQGLNGDKYGREEVSRQQRAARTQLERRVLSLIGFKDFDQRASLEWFRQGNPILIKDGRNLLSELSRFLDETYPLAPRIRNELVNRRSLSSAAAAARMRLIERMFSGGHLEWLGMDPRKKPPEMSMYMSVLLNTGIQQRHSQVWRIAEPDLARDEKCRVLPTFARMRELVQKGPDARINVAELFAQLRKPPYGVRDGLAPLLLTVFAIAHEQEIAFYKDGTFLRDLGGESVRLLTKAPERFEIQYCKIEGIRAEIFERLLEVMGLKRTQDRRVELLDVVKPLCVFVAKLPGYVLGTRKLSPTAARVRDTILNARDPARLLFTELPEACKPVPPDLHAPDAQEPLAFVKTLKTALDELRAAYPELQERLRQRLRLAFESPGPFQQLRTSLATRAEQVVLGVTEPNLRAFCLRLVDHNLAESDWLESLGSSLAAKPPAKWQDADEEVFAQELGAIATRFHRVESILFAKGKPSRNGAGIRVAITQANGAEHEQVVHFSTDEETELRDMQKRFELLLAADRRLGLAAASRAIWAALEVETKAKT